MTKFTTIPAGYRLSVTSWENDGDNYKTEILEGLTETKVRFYIGLLKVFDSESEHSNHYELNEIEMYRIVNHIDNRMILLTDPDYSAPEDDIDSKFDYINDILYMLGMTSDWAIRVFDRVKVEYIPHEITMEDVTEQFK